MHYYGPDTKHIQLIEYFIGKIPKNSRKKLIKLVFLYERHEETPIVVACGQNLTIMVNII